MSLFLIRCVGSYEEKNPKKPIVLSGKGTDGLEGILPLLESDVVAYALLRVVSKSLNHLHHCWKSLTATRRSLCIKLSFDVLISYVSRPTFLSPVGYDNF